MTGRRALERHYAHPQGTIDPTTGAQDVMHVSGIVGGQTVDQEQTSQDPNMIAHTFTIHSIPTANQPWLYLACRSLRTMTRIWIPSACR